MAQDITLQGASYSDVPSVVLPKTGGGTAQFDDTTDATASAADIAQGMTAYVNGAKVTGTASGGGGNDFIVTLSYNDSTETWEPDCTYAEAYAAVQAGKNVVAEAGDYNGASIIYDNEEYGGFLYIVFEQFDEFNGTPYYNFGVNYNDYIWTSDGIELDNESINYDTAFDTATPSDVAQGKYFHNASGIQVGTSSGGGSVTVKTTTMTNNSATATQIQFTSLTGQPKAFFCRCTSNLSRNSSNRYYYIADIRWDGSSTGGVTGNKYYVYNGQYSNQTTGYSQSYSNNTLTLTTTGSQTASPGSFYNGTYELVYVY